MPSQTDVEQWCYKWMARDWKSLIGGMLKAQMVIMKNQGIKIYYFKLEKYCLKIFIGNKTPGVVLI